MSTENFSPLDPIKQVLLGPPGTEAVLGLMMPPDISLFESTAAATASVVGARRDHERMQERLADHDIVVFNMRQIIGEVLANKANHPFSSKELFLHELENRALKLRELYPQMAGDPEFRLQELEELVDIDIEQMGLDGAIAINGVLTNILDANGNVREFDPINYPPLANFLFWRDTNHITAGQMGTHKMHYIIRQQEVVLAQLGFDALGINYTKLDIGGEVRSNASGAKYNTQSIEGGDILPMELNNELYAIIGAAERTSLEAVHAWFALHEAEFSASGQGIIPVLVEGPTSGTQEEMHIDTFAQQIAPGAIIHCGEITRNRDVSFLVRKGGEIIQVRPGNKTGETFSNWIEKNATNAFDMTREEQLNYAPNVLVNGSLSQGTTVFITRDGTPRVTDFIREHATQTVLLQMNELTKFYGGAHCATSEIR